MVCLTTLSFGGDQTTYTNINGLGSDPNNVFYQNLLAVQKQLSLDAINLDDEGTTVYGTGDYYMNVCEQIASWCVANGLKVSIAPYTNEPFWEQYVSSVNTSNPGTIDAVYLQCYAGPIPSAWNGYLAPLTMVAGFNAAVSTSNPTQVQQTLESWAGTPMAGGFMFTGTSMVVGYGGNPPVNPPTGTPLQYAQAIVDGLKGPSVDR